MADNGSENPPQTADPQTGTAAATQAPPAPTGAPEQNGGAGANRTRRASAQTAQAGGDNKTAEATTPGEGTQAPSAPSGQTEEPPAPPARRQLSEAEIRADERERQAREAADERSAAERTKLHNELTELRRNGGRQIRGLLNRIEDEANIRIDPELRNAVEDWVENLNAKAFDAAKLEVGNGGGQAAKTLTDVSNALYDLLDPSEEDDFTKVIRSTDAVGAIKEFSARRVASGHADAVEEFLADGAELLPEEHRNTFLEAAKEATTTGELAKALYDAALAAAGAMPRQQPNLTGANPTASVQARDLDEARAFHAGTHPSGVRWSNAQFRQWQADHPS